MGSNHVRLFDCAELRIYVRGLTRASRDFVPVIAGWMGVPRISYFFRLVGEIIDSRDCLGCAELFFLEMIAVNSAPLSAWTWTLELTEWAGRGSCGVVLRILQVSGDERFEKSKKTPDVFEIKFVFSLCRWIIGLMFIYKCVNDVFDAEINSN